MATQSSASAASTQQTTTFSDTAMVQTVGFSYQPDPSRDNVFLSRDDSLAKFFERPIVIATSTWTPLQASPFTSILDPWSLFFGNKRVVNRVNNFALMRANLHVRFMINGNGFYYGRLMADYGPLPTNDQCSSYATLIAENAVQASQRLKVFIDPSDCCSVQLDLPFVYYKDAISPISAEWANLGRITVRELNGLKHANGSAQPINIQVMAWATDVHLALPTAVNSSALVTQAGEDEYSSSPISTTATAVASVASKFSSAPIIGPYARATEMAARGAGAVAKMFGYSRPANISPLTTMRPTYVSPLAPTNAGDCPTKLAVDVKQELTVDPGIIGIQLEDELSIASIAARESFLTTFAWGTAGTAGDLLWNTYVTPHICRISGSTYYQPACAFASLPFQFWRGKMRYRFQVVASGYHKGRLRLVWDPWYAATVEGNVQMTKIIDISEDRDVVVEIDWGQPMHYLNRSAGNARGTTTYGTSARTAPTLDRFNGVLAVYVMNDLATPNSTVNNDVNVNVFVSCNDMEVGVPLGSFQRLSNQYSVTVQAGEDESSPMGEEAGCGTPAAEFTMGVDGTSDQDALVYLGERVTSFRQLLKRYYYHSSFFVKNTSATVPGLWTANLPDYPPYYGYNAATLHTTTTGAKKFNYTTNGIMHYLAPAFVGSRGAQRSKYVVSSNTGNEVQSATVERGYTGVISIASAVVPLSTATTNSDFARIVNAAKASCSQGAVITPPSKQNILEVEFPYYNNIRFDEARLIDSTSTLPQSTQSGTHTLEIVLAPGTTPVTVDRYISTGEDFTFFWFQGCPPLDSLIAPA